jgi:hypothetical protein
MLCRYPTGVSVAGGALVAIALAIALAGHGREFVIALGSAPVWVLGAAVALHVVWLIARSEAWSGVDASVLDSTALLIGLAVVGLFPVGPSLGAAAAVLILGTNGVAASAAAGALLTATAAVGALCFASWAVVDRLWPRTAAAARATA